MNFDYTSFYLLAAIAAVAFAKWYSRYSQRAARREWAAYHRWVRGIK